MNTILVAGHICVDLVPTLSLPPRLEPGGLEEIGAAKLAVGGCVGNTARTLLELGRPVRVSAAVGSDALSNLTENLIGQLGIDPRGLIRTVGETSYSVVLQLPDRDRSIWHFAGANVKYGAEPISLDLKDISILHIGYPSLLPALLEDNGTRIIELLAEARSRGITTSLDLAVIDRQSAVASLDWDALFRRICPLIDVFTPSFDDLKSALGPQNTDLDPVSLAERFVAYGCAVVTVSSGSEGIFLRTAASSRFADAGAAFARSRNKWAQVALWEPAQVIDTPATTNGAGDAATGGFLAAIDLGLGPRQAIEIAVITATARISGSQLPPLALSENATPEGDEHE